MAVDTRSRNRATLTRRDMLKGTAMMTLGTTMALAGTASSPAAAQSVDLSRRNLMRDKRPILHEGGTAFGAYDPNGDFANEDGLVTEHVFLPWEDANLSDLADMDDYAHSRGRKIMITIEPWSWMRERRYSAPRLRDLTLSGGRDTQMRAVLAAVSDFRSPLIIRWAHEMDCRTGRFSWQNWAPADYIRGYRRMAALTREMLPDAALMWSPKGEPTLNAYYPGDDVVDIIGLSVFGLQAFDEVEYGAPRRFAEVLRPGYERCAGYGKPIWVAELGYEGPLSYLRSWVGDVTRRSDEFPALEEVIYFNDREVNPWPHDLGLPDWRVVRDRPVSALRRPSR